MKIWIDAQLSPHLALWINTFFHVEAQSLREVGLRDASDREIFDSARKENVIVMTKDSDFITLLDEQGSPPQILLIACGNTSNKFLKQVLEKTFLEALHLLEQGESLVEIRD